LERSLPFCQKVPYYLPWIASALGYAYAFSGRVAEALPLQAQALHQSTSMGAMQWEARWAGWLGETYLLAGRWEDAMQCSQRALDLSRDRKERGNEAWALRLHGEIASHQTEVATAEAHYNAALAIAVELAMRPLQAHCSYGLARLYRVARRQVAPERLRTAIALYSGMNMQFWMQKAQTEMDQLG
jgi:tetratricopeptide (TPR) repeat protein